MGGYVIYLSSGSVQEDSVEDCCVCVGMYVSSVNLYLVPTHL